MRATSSRLSRLRRYSSALPFAHGVRKSASSVIRSTIGAAKISTGFTHAVSGSPDADHTTISESR